MGACEEKAGMSEAEKCASEAKGSTSEAKRTQSKAKKHRMEQMNATSIEKYSIYEKFLN